MSRVVVIGAGVGGLAAAARLAAAGHRVVVCEQAQQVGGKLGWWTRDGVGFDTGPSLLTLPDVLRETFGATGGWPADLSLQPVEPIATSRFADGTSISTSTDPDATGAAMERFTPGAGEKWRALMERAEQVWEATRGPFLEQELHGARTLARLAAARPGDLPLVAPWRTLADEAELRLSDPRLRALIWRYATYSGSDPRQAPAALLAIAYAEQHFGAFYVAGGLHRIAVALADRVAERGGAIRLGTDVTQVLVAGGRVAGVRLADGGTLPADVVVCNADARQLYSGLLTGAAGGPGRRRVARAPVSYSGLALLLGVRGPRPAGLGHHTVLFPADYSAEFDDLAAGRPVTDPAIYLSVPQDPAVAAAGIAPWFVLVNAPRHRPEAAGRPGDGGHDWSDPSGYADRVLGLLAARGIEVRDRLAFCEIRSPADLQSRTRAPGGAIYGSSSNGPRAAFLRPANRSAIGGLFLVGGSAHPGGGLPLVLLSARITAGLIGAA